MTETNPSCPLPTPPADDEASTVRRLLQAKRIAVVGISHNPDRASNSVASYLISRGFTVLPINPRYKSVLGLTCYPTLQDAPGPIDLVDVFRRAEFCPDVVRDAIAAGAKAVWLQSGITSDEAAQLARSAGLDFVQNRCLMVDHHRCAHR